MVKSVYWRLILVSWNFEHFNAYPNLATIDAHLCVLHNIVQLQQAEPLLFTYARRGVFVARFVSKVVRRPQDSSEQQNKVPRFYCVVIHHAFFQYKRLIGAVGHI